MRWLKFNAVGAMGMTVQIATLAIGVHLLELHYIFATLLSVEAALLHNFVWHVRWTWPTHTDHNRWPVRSLLHYQLITGPVSMAGNIGLMRVLVGTAQLEPVLANLVSIGACSLVNFAVCKRIVFVSAAALSSLAPQENTHPGFDMGGRGLPRFGNSWKQFCICLGVFSIVGFPTLSRAEGPRGDTIQAWNEYVLLTEARIGKELNSGNGFLAQDFEAPTEAWADREAVLRGQLQCGK